MERSPKKFLVDGSYIRVIRRGVEHFCIEKKIVPTLNKFLSAVKEKNIYIFFSYKQYVLHSRAHDMGFKWKNGK